MPQLTSASSANSHPYLSAASKSGPGTGAKPVFSNTGTHSGKRLTCVASGKKAPHFLQRLANRIYGYFHGRRYAVISTPKNCADLLVRPLQSDDSWVEVSVQRPVVRLLQSDDGWMEVRHPSSYERYLNLRNQLVVGSQENFAETIQADTKVPLKNINDRFKKDESDFKVEFERECEKIESQGDYEKAPLEIRFWIAYQKARGAVYPTPRPVLDGNETPRQTPSHIAPLSDIDYEGLPRYQKAIHKVLLQNEKSLAAHLGKSEEELDAWWKLDVASRKRQSPRFLTTPANQIFQITVKQPCIEVVCSENAQKAQALGISKEALAAKAEALMRAMFNQPDAFSAIHSRGNPLPAIAGSLSEAMAEYLTHVSLVFRS